MLFLPVIPDSELAGLVRGVLKEEGRRLDLRVVERGECPSSLPW